MAYLAAFAIGESGKDGSAAEIWVAVGIFGRSYSAD